MDLKETLNSIGYTELRDDGNYWRTAAIYREGDNKTALRINKNSGAFTDFVQGVCGSFDDLVKLTLNIGGVELKDFYAGKNIDTSLFIVKETKPKIVMDKTWSIEELSNLLPHYKFYEDKGISAKTLKFFKGGFAHSGSMNERFVFPIFNKQGQIHGWSGRDMTDKKEAKWKHIGRKGKWVYPVYLEEAVNHQSGTDYIRPCLQEITEKQEVILVESIGDMLKLWEQGIRNVIVTFGLDLSSSIISFLVSLDLKRIVLALNNDSEKEVNRGKKGAVEMFIDLMNYFDFEKIVIALPPIKDFGAMNPATIDKWYENIKSVDKLWFYQDVLVELRQLYSLNKITKDQLRFGSVLKEKYEELKASQT